MRIDIYVIETASGNVTAYGDRLDFLTPQQLRQFNEIGYSGQGDREEFLNSLNVGQFRMRTLVSGRMDFTEKFIIVRVTPNIDPFDNGSNYAINMMAEKDVSNHLQDVENLFKTFEHAR